MSTDSGEKEELRVKVAEAMGYKPPFHHNMDRVRIGGHTPGTLVWDLPNYPSSLDACRELLDQLKDNGWLVILERTPAAYSRGGPWHVWLRHGNDGGHTVLSTSNESLSEAICEAFLKVKGKP